MKLKVGDPVVVVAPASSMTTANAELVPAAVALLESWDLIVRLQADNERHFYLAGSDDDRAAALNDALHDEHVRAIFATRGGYGSQRVLPYLDLESVPSDRLLVGFSDITALHMAALAQEQPSRVLPVHGPNVATHQLLDDSNEAEQNRADLHRALFSPATIEMPVTILQPGQCTGRLVGGCLSLVSSLVGTPFLPSFDNTILFLEDVGEAPYSIDRMLTQLGNAVVLGGVRGFVFGEMHKCRDSYNQLEDVIVDVLGPFGVPIAFDLPSGHGPSNMAIPLGTPATLSTDASSITITPWSTVAND